MARNKNSMTSKDIITVVLLSLINLVIFSLGTVFYLTPITVVLTPVVYALLQGIVFFMIGVKVRKRGAMLLYALIEGVVAFNLPYLLMYLLGGIIAELILFKTTYQSPVGLTVSYTVMQCLASLGSTVYPYAIILDKTLENMDNTGKMTETIRKASEMIASWRSLLLVLLVAVASVAGALFGYAITKKHLAAAVAASEEDEEDAPADADEPKKSEKSEETEEAKK